MREIKFRAWDYKYKYMNHRVLIGNMSDDDNYCAHSAWVEPDKVDYACEPHWANFDESGMEVMQYTGAKDLNGAEIYEDDIITWSEETNHGSSLFKAVVVWSDDSLEYVGINELGWSMCLYEIVEKNGWVVGNVYENPELLETQ